MGVDHDWRTLKKGCVRGIRDGGVRTPNKNTITLNQTPSVTLMPSLISCDRSVAK